MPAKTVFRTCSGCRNPFVPRTHNQRYCTNTCKPAKLRNRHNWQSTQQRGTTTQRGYGYAHDKARAAALASLKANPGQPCARCAQPMWPHQELHLDHTPDRTTYLGLAHARCNLTAAAHEANRRKRHTSQAPRASRNW